MKEKKWKGYKRSCLPPQGMWQTLEKNKLEEKQKQNTTCKQSGEKTRKRRPQREDNGQTEAQSTLPVAATVWGMSSIVGFSLFVRVVPRCHDCRLHTAFVKYVQTLEVRQYGTSRAGLSSTDATRLLQYCICIYRQKEGKYTNVDG